MQISKSRSSAVTAPSIAQAASAILNGRPFRRLPGVMSYARRERAYPGEELELTLAMLSEAFPNDPQKARDSGVCPHRYAEASPLERALLEVMADITGAWDIDESVTVNPLYIHEMRMALRRTLAGLLALANREVQDGQA